MTGHFWAFQLPAQLEMPACLSIQLDLGIPAALKGQNVTESQTWKGHLSCHSDTAQLGWRAAGIIPAGESNPGWKFQLESNCSWLADSGQRSQPQLETTTTTSR